MARIGPGVSLAGHGSASMASRRTPVSWAARIIRTPISRVRTQRVRPLCASLAITTGACPNPHRIRPSTGRQPCTAATSRRVSRHPSARRSTHCQRGGGFMPSPMRTISLPSGDQIPVLGARAPGAWPRPWRDSPRWPRADTPDRSGKDHFSERSCPQHLRPDPPWWAQPHLRSGSQAPGRPPVATARMGAGRERSLRSCFSRLCWR